MTSTINYDLLNQDKAENTKLVKDMTVKEMSELIVKCIKECKKQEADRAEKQYGELWLKRKSELNPIF